MFGMPMPGMSPFGMMGMGMMGPMMPMLMMMQMMQMMQMLQMMMGQQQQRCGCDDGYGTMSPGMDAGMGFPQGGPPPYSPPYMPWSGGYAPPCGCGGWGPESVSGPQPYNPVTGNRLADTAGGMAGNWFKPGQTCRCADFVSTMLERSGTAPPGFRHQEGARGFLQYGRPVGQDDLKPGDVVMFKNTYNAAHGHPITHVGIYLGNGRFAHRPTANKPVRIDRMDQGYWANHFGAARRMNA